MAQYSSSVLCKVLAVSWQLTVQWSPYNCDHGPFPTDVAKNLACQILERAAHCLASDTNAQHLLRLFIFLEKYLLSIPGHEKVPEDRACSYLATTVGIVDYLFYHIVKCNKIVFIVFFTVVLILLYNVSYWICLCSNKICSTII